MTKQPGDIVISDAEIAELKESAIFAEKNRTHFSVRFLVVGGLMTPEKFRSIAALADRFGNGTIHLTTRQGAEIPHVPYAKLAALRKSLETSPLEPARSGRCVRSITACPGTYCKFSDIDTQQLAADLFEQFGNRNNLPHKFKIAVCGCSHCCSKPQENDLGVMGEGKNYIIFVGGMAGKTSRWGDRFLFAIRDKNILFRLVDAIIQWYVEHGVPKERFGTTIERVGLPQLVTEIEKIVGCEQN
ncbi:MAG: hypothetical protein LBJ67_11645 [Planctomycetaceae bacterium]|jgi:dissimilatory sulfite reductase (desulfoviridin) alpha/beta subunit|nr:hypothetical protein [Planctomycetaceae bacterium]